MPAILQWYSKGLNLYMSHLRKILWTKRREKRVYYVNWVPRGPALSIGSASYHEMKSLKLGEKYFDWAEVCVHWIKEQRFAYTGLKEQRFTHTGLKLLRFTHTGLKEQSFAYTGLKEQRFTYTGLHIKKLFPRCL